MNHCHRFVAVLMRGALIMLLCCGGAAPAMAITLNMSFPGHHVAYHQTYSTLTVSADLNLDSGTWTVDYFKIIIDGQTYDAAVTGGQNYFSGSYTLDVSNDPNPKEHSCYAIAQATYTAYNYTQAFNSTNPVNNGSGTNGDGHVTKFILSNIKFKGLIWQSRPCDVDDNGAAIANTDGT